MRGLFGLSDAGRLILQNVLVDMRARTMTGGDRPRGKSTRRPGVFLLLMHLRNSTHRLICSRGAVCSHNRFGDDSPIQLPRALMGKAVASARLRMFFRMRAAAVDFFGSRFLGAGMRHSAAVNEDGHRPARFAEIA